VGRGENPVGPGTSVSGVVRTRSVYLKSWPRTAEYRMMKLKKNRFRPMDRKETTTTSTRAPHRVTGLPHPIHNIPLGLFAYIEEGIPRIKALTFVDDVAWLAEDADENEISTRLEETAAAAQ